MRYILKHLQKKAPIIQNNRDFNIFNSFSIFYGNVRQIAVLFDIHQLLLQLYIIRALFLNKINCSGRMAV